MVCAPHDGLDAFIFGLLQEVLSKATIFYKLRIELSICKQIKFLAEMQLVKQERTILLRQPADYGRERGRSPERKNQSGVGFS
jgi:hypothetical protein